MKNINAVLLIVGLLFAAGVSAEEWDKTSSESLCENFGFTKGTDAFAQCMQTEYTKNGNQSSCKELSSDIKERARSCRFRCIGKYGIVSTEVPDCYADCNKELNKLPSGC
jgi:hypothetical protein